MTCPECGSTNIRTSRRSHWTDTFQNLRGQKAYRCRQCRLRFYAPESTDQSADSIGQSKRMRRHRSSQRLSTRTKQRIVRRIILWGIFAVAFIVFLFFLRYIVTEHAPVQDSGEITPVASAFSV